MTQMTSEPDVNDIFKSVLKLIPRPEKDNTDIEQVKTISYVLSMTADTWYYKSRNPEVILSAVMLNSIYEIICEINDNGKIYKVLAKVPDIQTYITDVLNKSKGTFNIDIVHEDMLEMLKND